MEYLFIILVLIILIYVYSVYNSLVKAKNLVEEAFSTMDVYLKKRWDLIPNLVETVRGYSEHEKSTLESIVNLRSNVYDNMGIKDKINTNENLNNMINKLMILSESYPELKANQNFLDLSKNLTKLEDDIANSRKYYNAVVREINNQIEMFPSNFLSKIFGYKSYKMFEASNNEREAVKVSL